jgi:cytochrome c553
LSAAGHTVSFSKEVKPIFEASCITCHGRGKDKGGFRLDTRETTLQGGDNGPAVIPGKSAESSLIALVQGVDPDNVMPRKGSRLTPEQVGILRAWIDQGMLWDTNVTFGRVEPANLKPRLPVVPIASKAPTRSTVSWTPISRRMGSNRLSRSLIACSRDARTWM